mmetsp:Transcript_86088/g.239600  ORF Transcript_86088/g.239600 Transcript_86088/m.239600 type:complete len:213 (-) Transcript_86088:341-979(-)
MALALREPPSHVASPHATPPAARSAPLVAPLVADARPRVADDGVDTPLGMQVRPETLLPPAQASPPRRAVPRADEGGRAAATEDQRSPGPSASQPGRAGRVGAPSSPLGRPPPGIDPVVAQSWSCRCCMSCDVATPCNDASGSGRRRSHGVDDLSWPASPPACVAKRRSCTCCCTPGATGTGGGGALHGTTMKGASMKSRMDEYSRCSCGPP